jgi:hypothetical protein
MKVKGLCFRLILVSIVLILFCPLLPGLAPATFLFPDTITPALTSYPDLQNHFSGYFTENKGQWDESILYMGITSFGKVAFQKDSIIFELLEESKTTLMQVIFVSGKPQSILGKHLLAHQSNYFLGTKMGIKCRNYHQIYLSNVWKGIDLVYSFTEKGVKQEFHLHSGADLADIQLQMNEVEFLPYMNPDYRPIKPYIFPDMQISAYTYDSSSECAVLPYYDGSVLALKSEYYPFSDKLIIESFLFATFLGGSGKDFIHSIAVDEDGHIYATGSMQSHDFPQKNTSGEVSDQDNDHQVKGDSDVFVAKLNPSGTELLYVSYLGGEGLDSANSIAINSLDCVFITGHTFSPDFPMDYIEEGSSIPGYDKDFKGTSSAFAVKLNPTGSEIAYSTFLGGIKADYAEAIAIDANDNAYITGYTFSPDFPMSKTVGGEPAPGYDQDFRGRNATSSAFVVKLNPSGTELLYATFLSGSNSEMAHDLALDFEGNAYITGRTNSPDIFTSKDPERNQVPGYDQKWSKNQTHIAGFAVKLNSSGTKLLYATFLAGSQDEAGQAIQVDKKGCAYIAGWTSSPDFPMSKTVGGEPAPGYDQNFKGLIDPVWGPSRNAFVVRLNATGTEFVYATFLGGSGVMYGDFAEDIALDGQGNLFITGRTTSSDFPMSRTLGGESAPGYSHAYNNQDAYLVKLNSFGTELLYAAFLGGSKLDWARSLVVDKQGQVYVAGYTWSPDFPMSKTLGGESAPGYDQELKGEIAGFIIKLAQTTYGIHIVLTIGSKIATLNEKSFELDVAPMIISSRTMVPLRFIAEGFGAHVAWFPESDREIQLILGNQRIRLWIGKAQALVETLSDSNQVQNTKELVLEVVPSIIQGRTLVPLRFIAESFGAVVEWDGEKQRIEILFKE